MYSIRLGISLRMSLKILTVLFKFLRPTDSRQLAIWLPSINVRMGGASSFRLRAKKEFGFSCKNEKDPEISLKDNCLDAGFS